MLDKYELEYRFIPGLVDAFNQGNIPVQALLDVPWWEQVLREMGNEPFGFIFSDIKAEVRTLAKGTTAILYCFPEADESPLAKYGAILLNGKAEPRYYTFETDDDPNLWFLCGQDVGRHLNYGSTQDCPTLDDFVSLLEERFLGEKSKPAGEKMGFLRQLFHRLGR